MSNAIIYSLIAIIAESIELKYEMLFWLAWLAGLIFKFVEDKK